MYRVFFLLDPFPFISELTTNITELEKKLQARHVFLLLCQFVNYIEVVRLPVYCPSEQEKEDPKLYANNVRKLIATEVLFIPLPKIRDDYLPFSNKPSGSLS